MIFFSMPPEIRNNIYLSIIAYHLPTHLPISSLLSSLPSLALCNRQTLCEFSTLYLRLITIVIETTPHLWLLDDILNRPLFRSFASRSVRHVVLSDWGALTKSQTKTSHVMDLLAEMPSLESVIVEAKMDKLDLHAHLDVPGLVKRYGFVELLELKRLDKIRIGLPRVTLWNWNMFELVLGLCTCVVEWQEKRGIVDVALGGKGRLGGVALKIVVGSSDCLE
jgi:hypothetical protein